MKKCLLFLVFGFVVSGFSQEIRGFGGLNAYLKRGLDNDGYANVHAGLDFKIKKYLKPEFEVSLYFGSLQTNTTNDDFGNVIKEIRTTFNAVNYSFCPKIIFGDGETHGGFLQVLPKFNITRSEAIGDEYVLNNKNGLFVLNQTDSAKDFLSSFGIGVGFIVNLSETNLDALAFNLYYDNIDLVNATNLLNFGSKNLHSNQVLGAGIKYYFGIIKQKKL